MKVKLDPGAYMPERAHECDAGYDLRSPIECSVLKNGIIVETVRQYSEYVTNRKVIVDPGSVIIDTGVHVEIPKGYVGFIKSRSGLNLHHGITAEGVIDSGYTGSIRVKLYNNGVERYNISKGDKIAQMVILPILTPDLELVDELEATDRGDNGFGSTGR